MESERGIWVDRVEERCAYSWASLDTSETGTAILYSATRWRAQGTLNELKIG